ncbi:MAG TPA: hypothetical protein VHJ78_05545 [Actinomycetota bacterium]|nr:hypothetical protein [Actinomycetota bacterium]
MSRQVPPGSPFDPRFREETIPLGDRTGDASAGGLAGFPDAGTAAPIPAGEPVASVPPPAAFPPPGATPRDEGVFEPRLAPARGRTGVALSDIAREMSTPETKESFKTSEFMVLLLGVVGVLLASEVSEEFDAPRAWMAITILGIGYMLSRGFAKAGTRRDYSAASRSAGLASGYGMSEAELTSRRRPAGELADQLSTPETKEFYKSTEFLLWALGVVGLLLAAQANAEFDATEAWRLITYLSSGYIVSRGLAKAATDRGYDDPNYGLPAVAGASGAGREAEAFTRRHISTPETKEFFKTSEFLVLVLAILGIAIASNVDLLFDAPSAWTFLTIVGAAYMVSRGLAKLGARDPHRFDGAGGRTYR